MGVLTMTRAAAVKRIGSDVVDLDDDSFENQGDWDEDVNAADYELAEGKQWAQQDGHARVTCLFKHLDVGADLSGDAGSCAFDEVFDARIGDVLSELAGMVEGGQ
jgi:hypothetical protein